jgi:RHS repeat-associated protein
LTHSVKAGGWIGRAENITNALPYTCSANSLRLAQSVGGEVTTFVWDLASLLAQVLATSDGARYVHGVDLVAERRSGARAYPLGDALGSVRQWTDEDGYVTYAGGYTPFGTQMWTEGSTSSKSSYTGEWWDTRAGLLYLRARWLDVESGRFLSQDPIIGSLQQSQSINRYSYVLGNPLRYRDPTGRYGEDVHYVLTKQSVYGAIYYEAMARGYPPDAAAAAARDVASTLAAGDQGVDEVSLGDPDHALQVGSPHWWSHREAREAATAAVDATDPEALGRALHGVQDYFAHFGQGFTLEMGTNGIASHATRWVHDDTHSVTGVFFSAQLVPGHSTDNAMHWGHGTDPYTLRAEVLKLLGVGYGSDYFELPYKLLYWRNPKHYPDYFDPDDPWDQLAAGETQYWAERFAPAYLNSIGWYSCDPGRSIPR